MATKKIRIVCISDTHNHAPGEGYTLPAGDILIHAGDLTNQGSYQELKKATDWISRADFAVKVVVAGNHDLSLDPAYSMKHESGWEVMPDEVEACRSLMHSDRFVYFQHSSAVIRVPGKDVSLKIFGSPYSPDRGRQNWAFQYDENSAAALWDEIALDTDILVTHTPPAGFCDESRHWEQGGCTALADVLPHVRPSVHICGHCHEGRGACVAEWSDHTLASAATRIWSDPSDGTKKLSKLDLRDLRIGQETAIVNASIMGRSHGHGGKLYNKPVVLDLHVAG
jgi:3',5'-cyclic AMP phosphodiesterase CpdA